MASGKFVTVPFASAARTASPTAVEVGTQGYDAAYVFIDVTAISLTPSVVFNVDWVDPVSGQVSTLLASAAVTATGQTTLKIGPGLTAAANTVANEFLPPIIQVRPVHADTDSITYSVTVHLC